MPTSNGRLRRERQLRGWSQAYLAKQIDVPDYYISRWERREVTPSAHYQQKLCELFGKTAEELGMMPTTDEHQKSLPLQSVQHMPQHAQSTIEIEKKAESPTPALAYEAREEREPEEQLGNSLQFEYFSPFYSILEQPSEAHFAVMQDQSSSAPNALRPSTPHVPDPVTPLPDATFLPSKPLLPPKSFVPQWKRVVFLMLALLCITGTGLGIFLQMFIASHASAVPVSFVGHLSYVSSGQTSDDSNQGIADTIRLDITHVMPSPPGKSYYAWLLPDSNNPEGPVMLLGTLMVQQGHATLIYSDKQHGNLLASTSRFLVTEESSSVPPLAPSLDKHTWRYTGMIPQTRPANAPYSFLEHLRHLLAADPALESYNLSGGVTPWLAHNTEQVAALSIAAKDAWQGGGKTDPNAVRQHVIRVLEYLDGISFVQTDAPAHTAFPILVNRRIASVGLLQLSARQTPLGYVYHVNLHLTGLVTSAPVSDAYRAQVQQIVEALKGVNDWLDQLHKDAQQLVLMSDEQLRQTPALTLLNDMLAQANFAYFGTEDPVSGQTEEGVEWIYQQMQRLVTMDIELYMQ